MFYKLLLKSCVHKKSKLLKDIKRNREIGYLSEAQAKSILNWMKKIGKHLDSSIPIETVKLESLTEQILIERIASLTCEADLTASFEELPSSKKRKSTILDVTSLISNPRATPIIDAATLDVVLEKSCKRAIWALGYYIVEQCLPEEYLATLIKIIGALYIHARNSEKTLFGLSPDAAHKYLQNSNNNDFVKTLQSTCTKAIDTPDSPQSALSLAIKFVEQETGDRVGEDCLIVEIDSAIKNLIHLATYDRNGSYDTEKPVLSLTDPIVLGLACSKSYSWVLEPIASVEKLREYKVYFPFHITPPEILNNLLLGTKYVNYIPDSFQSNPGFKLMFDWMKSAIEVSVLAYSHKHSYKSALEKIKILLNAIALLYPYGYVQYQYDKFKYAVECDGNIEVKSFTPDGFIANLHKNESAVVKNVKILLELRKSPYSWIKQLSRCSSFIRKASESHDQETKFLHLWRALEAICGHLTGFSQESNSEKCFLKRTIEKITRSSKEISLPSSRIMSSSNYLVFAVLHSTNSMSPEKQNYTWADFDSVHTKIWRNLGNIMQVRSQWIVHTGDERKDSIEDVSDDYLKIACKFMVEEIIYPTCCYLTQVALENPYLETRKQVYEEVFLSKIEI